jgi:predicted membrane channel-forming protein YqfA (hemolysin III family)
MTRGLIYWVIMLLWLLSLVGAHFALFPAAAIVSTVILFVLFVLLGWQVFGPPVRG